jgi:hypothetical protein
MLQIVNVTKLFFLSLMLRQNKPDYLSLKTLFSGWFNFVEFTLSEALYGDVCE